MPPSKPPATAAKTAARKPPADEHARLLRPDIRVVQIPIEGLSPLLCHAWSHKAIGEMEAKQQQRARPAREAKNPDAEYRASLYPIDEAAGRYGFPASAFKKAIVRAAAYTGEKMTFLRGAFFVLGELVEIIDSDEPKMRQDMVRVGRGVADIRYRGQFSEWHAVLRIQYNARAISAEQLVNLVANAGFSVGVGEWRPEKDGSLGRFQVRSDE